MIHYEEILNEVLSKNDFCAKTNITIVFSVATFSSNFANVLLLMLVLL